MDMRKNKEVTYRSLKKGEKISGVTHDNMHCGFVAYVKEVSPAYVTVEISKKVNYSVSCSRVVHKYK